LYTTRPLVTGPSYLEDEIAIARLKKYKPPGTDEIPVELIQVDGETLVTVIHEHIDSF
jgi:hypothetical protein